MLRAIHCASPWGGEASSGKAAVARAGEALTILAYGTMVHVALAAAAETGVDAEILDLRTLMPIDIEAITGSVEKTGRCLVVQEAPRRHTNVDRQMSHTR